MFDLDDNVQTLDMEVQEVVQTKGEDGFSPIAKVTPTSSGAKISITDKNGTTETEVLNGTPDDYPQYVETEKASVLTKLKNLIGTISNPIVFGFNTDQHIVAWSDSGSRPYIRSYVGYGLRVLRDLTKELPFNLVVLGGDANGTQGEIEQVNESVMWVSEQMRGCDAPMFHLVGNHDGGQDNNAMTMAQAFKPHLTKSVQDKVVAISNRLTYGIYDDVTCNIRFILLNTMAHDTNNVNVMKEYLGNALSTLPTDYKAIIISHHPINSDLPQSADKTKWNNPVALQSVINQYTDKIICCINGHMHNSLADVVNNVQYISTTCAGWYELNDGLERVSNSANSTAFDVYVLDLENNKCHVIRYGVGTDREITLPTQESGVEDIFSDTTWADDKRLNSSGALTDASGYSTTDMIDVESGDVLYFEDGALPISTENVQIYNDDGTSGATINGISTTDYGATYTANRMYVSLRNADDTNLASYYWSGILTDKSNTSNINGKMFGEVTFYDSGYVKSAKVDYVNRFNCNGIRFTFPTAKKTVKVNINKPIE